MDLSKQDIETWRQQLKEGKLEACLKLMEASSMQMKPEMRNTLISLSGQFKTLKQNELQNAVEPEAARLQRNELMRDLLDLMDGIREDYLAHRRADMTITLAEDEAQFREFFQQKLEAKKIQLDECLSNGDYALVYRARKNPGTEFEETVAIKVFKTLSLIDSENLLDLRENLAKAKRRSSVDGIISIIDENIDSLPRYYVMPFIDGMTLSRRLKQGWPFTLREIRHILLKITEALQKGHAEGMVHNNLRPSNVFLSRGGDPKIFPFQLIRFTLSARHFGRIEELAMYSSPEQINTLPTTAASDQFSLALVAYELFSGRPFFEGSSIMDILHKRMAFEHRPEILEEELKPTICPPQFSLVLRRMLSTDPQDRYPDLDEVYAEIDEVPLPKSRTSKKAHFRALAKSFDHCRRQEDFYRDFYEQFFEERPEARTLFQEAFQRRKESASKPPDTFWRYQHQLLDLAIDRLLVFMEDPDLLKKRLDKLMENHLRLGVPLEDFPVFLRCLKKGLMSCDATRWQEEGEELGSAWQQVVQQFRRRLERKVH